MTCYFLYTNNLEDMVPSPALLQIQQAHHLGIPVRVSATITPLKKINIDITEFTKTGKVDKPLIHACIFEYP
jgi:hypothetical protein